MINVAQICQNAQSAQRALATASTESKNAVLLRAAQLLLDRSSDILMANQKDVAQAAKDGLTGAIVDRLTLTDERLAGIAQSLKDIARLPDPVGQLSDQSTRPNGLKVSRMRIPLGVIAIIFESRPNVVIDAGALCLKSGNATVLKGGKEAHHSNIALAAILKDALSDCGLPSDAVQLITDRGQVAELLKQTDTVELVIPRGGEGLIRYVTENSRIPVVQHYKGVCHVYVDVGADLAMAADIAFNAKVQRPGVCNAMETLLVHRNEADTFLPSIAAKYAAAGVEIRGCASTIKLISGAIEATDADYHEEYLDLTVAIKVVDDMNAAIEHIATYGSGHTEAIVTNDENRARDFVVRNPSSAVIVNASTRFNDGGQLGLGAEIGISTSKLHAYGPMGLEELTTRKFVVWGEGQIRS